MKFTAGRRTGSSVINLTPLIDCMFLLVIFIMIAARFDPDGGIPVDLPSARTPEAQKPSGRINISITAEGLVFLEQEPIAPENVEQGIVAARTAAGDPEGKDVVLVIHGDKDANHGRVVEVLDAAKRAGQQRLTIRTRE